MANNVQFNVYQINQRLVDGSVQSVRIGFPTAGIMIQSCINSPTRSLSSGYNVYGVILVPAAGGASNVNPTEYYVQETLAQLATAIG